MPSGPRASFTTSYAPTLIPPLVSTRSTPSSAPSSSRTSASGSSRTALSCRGSPPTWRTAATSIAELASKICAGPSTDPGATSSEPVERIRTCGRRCTVTLLAPIAAIRAMAAGSTTAPARSTTDPRDTSSPCGRMFADGAGRREIVTVCSPPSVHSTGTTASAPAGTGAPVITRTAAPGTTAGATVPAPTSPVTGRVTGSRSLACSRSAHRTAYPSIAELVNTGRSISARRSCASTAPSASSSPTVSGGSGPTPSRIAARYASTLLTGASRRGCAPR